MPGAIALAGAIENRRLTIRSTGHFAACGSSASFHSRPTTAYRKMPLSSNVSRHQIHLQRQSVATYRTSSLKTLIFPAVAQSRKKVGAAVNQASAAPEADTTLREESVRRAQPWAAKATASTYASCARGGEAKKSKGTRSVKRSRQCPSIGARVAATPCR